MAKITKDTKIKEFLENPMNYGSHSGEFTSIDPDYTFGEFWDAFKHGGDFTACLHIPEAEVEWLRGVLGKIQWQSGGKFRVSDRDFNEKLPLSLLYTHDLIDRVLEYLTQKKGWFIHAGDTHRWILSDGWYELQYTLCYNDGKIATSVYLDTHSSTDQEFEDEWKSCDGHTISYNEILWSCSEDDFDYKYAFRQMLQDKKAVGDIPEDMLAEIKRRVSEED